MMHDNKREDKQDRILDALLIVTGFFITSLEKTTNELISYSLFALITFILIIRLWKIQSPEEDSDEEINGKQIHALVLNIFYFAISLLLPLSHFAFFNTKGAFPTNPVIPVLLLVVAVILANLMYTSLKKPINWSEFKIELNSLRCQLGEKHPNLENILKFILSFKELIFFAVLFYWLLPMFLSVDTINEGVNNSSSIVINESNYTYNFSIVVKDIFWWVFEKYM